MAVKLLSRTMIGFLLVALFCLPVGAEPFSAMKALQQQKGASFSAAIVDLQTRQVLAENSANRSLIPASVTKLFTAGLALETWGPDHRFETRLLGSSPLRDGSVENLVLLGGGDPALTDEDFWKMARALSRKGLRRIEGDLVVNASRFGLVACNVQDRCEARQASRNAYDAPLSSAGSNYASWSIAVERQDGTVRTRLYPFDLPEVELKGHVASERGGYLAARRATLSGGRDVIELSGSLAPGRDGRMLYRSAGNPDLQTGLLFQAFLEEQGIAVQGTVRVTHQPPPESAVQLVRHRGDRLDSSLAGMMRYSNNYMSDVLLLNLDVNKGGRPPLTVAEAAQRLQVYARNLAESPSTVFPDAFSSIRLFDGSGLDTDNRLSAGALIALLDHYYRQKPGLFPAFLSSLTVPDHTAGSSLKKQDPDWLRRLAVKTGGLSEPVTVTSLAGYLRFRDGGWGAFAFLVNGAPGQPVPRAEIFEAMRQDLAPYWEGATNQSQ